MTGLSLKKAQRVSEGGFSMRTRGENSLFEITHHNPFTEKNY